MKKGRDTFTFQLKEPNQAQALINEWLQAYNFTTTNLKNGEVCYTRADPLTGCAFFNYQFQDNQLTLQIWQRSLTKDVSIYSSNLISGFYRDIMNQLLEKISAISSNQAPTTAPAQNGAHMNSSTNKTQAATSGNNFRDLSNKTDERLCIVGFIMALVNIMLVLLDGSVALGGLGYIILFVCAARGLKTEKRNLAIATIVLGVMSLIIFIVKLIDILK